MLLAGFLLMPGQAMSQIVESLPRVIAADEGAVGVGENGFTSWYKVGAISTGATQPYVGTGIVPPGAGTPMHLHEVDEEVLSKIYLASRPMYSVSCRGVTLKRCFRALYMTDDYNNYGRRLQQISVGTPGGFRLLPYADGGTPSRW